MDANATRSSRYNVSLIYYIIIFSFCLLPNKLEAKEASHFCINNDELCSNLSEALKDRPDQLSLKYERVIDGDTFVADGHIIRIWGIDAPESNEPTYRISGWLLQSLIKDKVLNCKPIYVDKYKRDVMQCYSEGIDIGSVMVKFGMAKDHKRYSAGYYQPEEKEAKSKKRGIWSK